MTTVHTRKTLVVGALALLLTGCGHEAGPTPQGGGQTAGPEALGIKLTALTADECYLNPTQQNPNGCAKYITELSSTSGTVREAGMPTLADALTKEINAYRADHCETIMTAGAPCSQTLSNIAATLSMIKQQAPVASPSR